MCRGCDTRTIDDMGSCPYCDGEICDVRDCPRQIACWDCEMLFTLWQGGDFKVTDERGIIWKPYLAPWTTRSFYEELTN